MTPLEMLTEHILPFWLTRMPDPRGGFYGRIDGYCQLHPDAEKGAVLNARILWTFSAAYRVLSDDKYLSMATQAKRALLDYFFDPDYGGVYWSLNADNSPRDTKKQIYALGFAIYGLSEYARATGDEEALAHAIKLFFDIENHSFDTTKNGYFEAFTREWEEIADMRLSDKDANERKTMNTHLHILEPYTNLYRVWPDDRLAAAIRNLLYLFKERILDTQKYRLKLFFDDDWNSKVDKFSYGHDIEASWLLHEAALVLGDKSLLAEMEPIVQAIAQHADPSMLYASPCQWWEYAETIVGYYNVWQHWGDEDALTQARKAWDFVCNRLLDPKQGEWYWAVEPPHFTPDRTNDLAGFWKCPYHNSRACLELIQRKAR